MVFGPYRVRYGVILLFVQVFKKKVGPHPAKIKMMIHT